MSPLSVIVPLGVSVSVPVSVTALMVDVGTGDGQVGQRGRAADGTLKVHVAAAGVQRQRLGAVHRRGEGDVPVGRVVVLVAVHRRVHGQVDRAGELDVAVVALVGGGVEVDVGALDVDRTRGLHRVEVDLPAVKPSGWSAWWCHPTTPCRSTAPPPASSVNVLAPFTVEVKVMSPSVASSSLSLSTVVLTARSTGPVKVMAPSSLS